MWGEKAWFIALVIFRGMLLGCVAGDGFEGFDRFGFRGSRKFFINLMLILM